MKKKLMVSALVLGAMLVGCAPTDAELKEQGWVKDPAENGWVENPAENGWVSEDELTPSPEVTNNVVHWVPGAEEATVSWTVDLKEATTMHVVFNGKMLTEFLEYEFNPDTGLLEIYGDYLTTTGLELGKHKGYVFTEHGSAEIEMEIIARADAEGSTIPLKEIQDIDLSGFTALEVTEPIANANDLLITEVGVDMGTYNYIEVFNNTTSEYNLKNHRIVFADPSKQKKNYENGLVDLPLAAAGSTFIYNDYKIPALSSAIIWIVNTTPWTMASNKMVEAAGIQSLLLGDAEENLNVADFKRVYGLDDETLVFPSRTNYILGRTDAWADIKAENGFWGTALAKSGTNLWTDINSSVDNRLIQIQKIDETTVFEEEGKFYVYDMDVLHREEDIYADGVLDANDVLLNNPGAAVGSKNREFIHGLFARKVYVTSKTDTTPTGEYSGMDLYNANEDGYYSMLEDAATPLATAMIYPKLNKTVVEEVETLEVAKWKDSFGQFALQYTIPAAGSHVARFIPLEGTTADYEAYYAEHIYKTLFLSGMGAEITGYSANSTVKVPVDASYPTDYLNSNHNTAGRITSLMIPAA